MINSILPALNRRRFNPGEVAVSDGLIIHYPFTGTYAGDGGIAFDASGQGNHGTLQGSGLKPYPTATVGDIAGESGRYESGAAVALPTAPLPLGALPRCFMCWLWIDVITTFYTICFYGNTSNFHERILFFVDSTNANRLAFDSISGADFVVSPPIATGRWWHVAFNILASGNTHFYMNGTVAKLSNVPISTTAPGAHGIQGDGSGTGNTQLSYMRDWRFYNRALSPGEISEIFVSGYSQLPLVPYRGQQETAVLGSGGGGTPNRGYIF